MFHLPRWLTNISVALQRLSRSRRKSVPTRPRFQLELLSERVLFSAGPLNALSLSSLRPDPATLAAALRTVASLEAGDNGVSYLHDASAVPEIQGAVGSSPPSLATAMGLDKGGILSAFGSSQPFPSLLESHFLTVVEETAAEQGLPAVEILKDKAKSLEGSLVGGVPLTTDEGLLNFHQLESVFRSEIDLFAGHFQLEFATRSDMIWIANRVDSGRFDEERIAPALGRSEGPAPMQGPQGAISFEGNSGAVALLPTAVMNGSSIADALERGDGAASVEKSAESSGMVEVNILDPDGSDIALATVGWDLPDASQQLVSLGQANRAVVPAYVVGEDPGASVVPVETRDELDLTSVVVGLDDPSSVVGRQPMARKESDGRNVPADRLFQELTLSKGAEFFMISSVPGAIRPAETSDAGARPLEGAVLLGMDVETLDSQWGNMLCGLSRPVGELGAAAPAILAEALMTFGIWRLTQWSAAGRNDQRLAVQNTSRTRAN